MGVAGEGELLQVVGALHSSCCLAGSLHCREKQGNQYADDGNDDKKFDQRESYSTGLVSLSLSLSYVSSILQHFAASTVS
jgi:hypothetical protein